MRNRVPGASQVHWWFLVLPLVCGCGVTTFQPINVSTDSGTFRFTDVTVDSKFDHLRVKATVTNKHKS